MNKLFQGDYIFKCYSNFSNGNNTVKEYFVHLQSKVYTIIFFENYNGKSKNDICSFIENIKNCESEYGIRGILGVEAPIMPNGNLNIDNSILDYISIIGMTENEDLLDTKSYFNSLNNTFLSYNKEKYNKEFIWLHPGSWLLGKNKLITYEKEYIELLNKAIEREIMVESSATHNMIKPFYEKYINREFICYGADIYSVDDIKKYYYEIDGRLEYACI